MLVVDGTSGVTFNDSSLQGAAASPFGLKNRIINGDMVIDQRNAGALINPAVAGYTVDRWYYFQSQTSKGTIGQNAGSVTPPTGYVNYLGFTSTSAYSINSTDQFLIQQNIEGLNTADLAWGTANARTVTLSFWVRSSLTGTFGGALQNSASNRCYPFSYTISTANTWTQISITITGDTTGTWLTTNGTGVKVVFSLASGTAQSSTAGAWTGTSFQTSVTGAVSVVGTNGATFYITGVQLERNTTATPFEWLPYTTELQLCQRYCVVYGREAAYNEVSGTGFAWNTTTVDLPIILSPQMRTVPSISSSGNFQISDGASGYSITSFTVLTGQSSSLVLSIRATVSSGLTAFRPYRIESANSTASTFTISAEL